MKKFITFFLISGILFFDGALQAQRLDLDANPGMYQSYQDFSSNPQTFNKGRIPLLDENGSLIFSNDALLLSEEKDNLGYTHYKYAQTYKGFIVQHAVYVFHVKNNLIESANGKFVKNFAENLISKASLSEGAALQFALSTVNARKYMWQDPATERFIKEEKNDPSATYFPKGQLVLYSGGADIIPSQLRLTYKFDIYAKEPISRQEIFVDAITGRIIDKEEKIHLNCHSNSTDSKKPASNICDDNLHPIKINNTTNEPVSSITLTGYSGYQTITSTKLSDVLYILRDETRGKGIMTYNMKKAGDDFSKAADFLDYNNIWNNANEDLDQYATDAHWGTEKTYDYFKNNFDRNSIDNNGFAIKNYVHTDLLGFGNFINAYWDGMKMVYGDGGVTDDNIKVTPLTALDIVGHEVTHGLTEFTSKLVYKYESGALNEGMSDIFGTAIEFYAKPGNADWVLGTEIGKTFRSMINPNAHGDPDTYNGEFWHTDESSDNGGVHHNSGVLNYWFYLLSQGGASINDHGTQYNVNGIGIDKAAAIAYRTNTYYLTPTSTFYDARNWSIVAAVNLFGFGSVEATQTVNAWYAVGIGNEKPFPPCTDIYEKNDGIRNDSINGSSEIPTDQELTAKLRGPIYYFDVDFYTFTTTDAKPKFKVELYKLPGNCALYLYDSNENLIDSSANKGKINQSIVYNKSNKGKKYFIKISRQRYSEKLNDSCYLFKISTDDKNIFDGGIIVNPPTPKGPFPISNGDKNDYPFIEVFPNPVSMNNNLTIQFIRENSGAEQLILSDLTGKIFFTKTINYRAGKNTISLPLPEISMGFYLLRLGHSSAKVSIQ